MENFEEAKKCYLHFLNINDENSETHLNLGITLWHMGLSKEAIQEFEVAYQYDNECIDAMVNKGIVLKELKIQ